MSAITMVFFVLAAALVMVTAKPSHHLSLQAIPDHFDFAPPVLPSVPFHAEDDHHAFDHGHFFDHGDVFDHAHAHVHGHILPPAPVIHEAPKPIFHSSPVALPCLPPAPPAPVVPAHAHLLPAPAPLLPAPVPVAPLLPPAPAHILRVVPLLQAPAPVVPAVPAPVAPVLPAAPLLPAPLPITRIHPPVYEAIPFAPSYRAIPGPKTTTHHLSVGYALPSLPVAHKVIGPHLPHAHLRLAPLSLPHHHHHRHHGWS